MKSEFETLEQYQDSMKKFNENTRIGFENFIQSHSSDRNKLQLRFTPYTDKKGGYGSFELDFGLAVWQHQQSKIDELQYKAKLRESDHQALLVKYQATKKCWEDISKEKDELQKRVDVQTKHIEMALVAVKDINESALDEFKEWDVLKEKLPKICEHLQNLSFAVGELEQALKGGSDE
ncbi:hypothetical protein ACPC5Q_02495 [Acinetobacter junii]|uniref:hypothetical protein n=1 Tax=Acinetobacter junii TaxID=40215 RepID=UPI003C14C991